MNIHQSTIERICVDCGKPINHSAINDICTWCLMKKNDPETMRQQAEYLEQEKLIKELGMPPDTAWKKIDIEGEPFGEKWKDYSIEMYGMIVGRLPTPDKDFPFFRWLVTEGIGIVIQLWQQRVRYNDSQVFGEVRFHPDRGLNYAIKGNILKASNKEISLAKKGFGLLAEVAQSAVGRPLNSGLITEENKLEALQAVIEIGKAIYRDKGKVSQEAIASQYSGKFGLNDTRSIYRLIKDYCKKDWKKDILPEIKAP